MLKTRQAKLFIFALLAFVPFSALAFETRGGSSVYIPAGQTVEGNLYSAGTNITVEGHVTGDLICAGQSITVNGKVDGSVICAGNTITVNGEVGESVRLAGASLLVNGKIAHNAMLFGATIAQGEKSSIGWDALAAGSTVDIRGSIGRSLHGAAEEAQIGGKIGSAVNLKFDGARSNAAHLKILDGAEIGGDVSYGDRFDAEVSPNAKIQGSVTRHEPELRDAKKMFSFSWGWGIIYALFSSLAVGLVLISLFKNQLAGIIRKMLEAVGKSIGFGALAVFLSPFLLIALFISIIGIPLSFMLLALFIIALYSSKIIAGVFIGQSLLTSLSGSKEPSLIWSMIIGVALVVLLCSLPIIGFILCMLATFWGLGGIYLYFKKS
jgi:cytoskeletal protein CcmA (bactofilin family)